MNTIRRPEVHESSTYFRKYIDLVESDNFLETLKENHVSTAAFLSSLTDEQWNHRYAEGKWSLKESFIHLIDTERIFTYRALRIARNDKTALLGFEQDDYVPYYNADQRISASVVAEYQAVRAATIQLYESLNDEDFSRMGTASGQPISPLALGFMTAGHEIHHLNLARERYLFIAK